VREYELAQNKRRIGYAISVIDSKDTKTYKCCNCGIIKLVKRKRGGDKDW